MPAVDGGIELHAGIAALPGGLGNLHHQITGADTIFLFVGADVFGPPVAVFDDGFHEIVSGANGVIGVLEEDGAIGLTVERGIVTSLDQSVGLLFLFSLAPYKALDVGMVDVEDDHLGGAARLAAGFDHTGKCVEAFHER